jgi:hypothetical protein
LVIWEVAAPFVHEVSCAIRAGHRAILTAYALIFVHDDDPVLALLGSLGGTDLGALRLFALHAEDGKRLANHGGKLPALSFENAGPEDPGRSQPFGLAVHLTCVAAVTSFEIDYETVPRHGFLPPFTLDRF